jgi:hypothetical protein
MLAECLRDTAVLLLAGDPDLRHAAGTLDGDALRGLAHQLLRLPGQHGRGCASALFLIEMARRPSIADVLASEPDEDRRQLEDVRKLILGRPA